MPKRACLSLIKSVPRSDGFLLRRVQLPADERRVEKIADADGHRDNPKGSQHQGIPFGKRQQPNVSE